MKSKNVLQGKVVRNTFVRYRRALLLAVAIFTLVQTAHAGGLYLNEFGTPSMGTAGAGSGAIANDASTSFHNPAGMTRVEGNQLMVTGGFLSSKVEFDPDSDTSIPGGDGGDAGSVAPILGTFYTRELSDQWSLGANIISISGASLDYDSGWTGRYLNDEVTLLTVTFNPTVGYKVNDWLSIGGGPQIMYGDLELKASAPPPTGNGEVKVDGDDVAFGFDVAALIELTEQTRIGFGYQSEIELEFDGDLKINGPGISVGTDTDFKLPQFLKLSGYHEINRQWAILGSIAWEDWSALDNINISTGRGTRKIPRNWDDVWKFSAGLHYRPVEDWTFQLGCAYDTSPVDAKDRTPDMPIDRQVRYAAGLQHQLNEKISLGGQFVYADYGDAKIKNNLLKGKYQKNNIIFLAFNVNCKF